MRFGWYERHMAYWVCTWRVFLIAMILCLILHLYTLIVYVRYVMTSWRDLIGRKTRTIIKSTKNRMKHLFAHDGRGRDAWKSSNNTATKKLWSLKWWIIQIIFAANKAMRENSTDILFSALSVFSLILQDFFDVIVEILPASNVFKKTYNLHNEYNKCLNVFIHTGISKREMPLRVTKWIDDVV